MGGLDDWAVRGGGELPFRGDGSLCRGEMNCFSSGDWEEPDDGHYVYIHSDAAFA
jgi:hypothetical protein